MKKLLGLTLGLALALTGIAHSAENILSVRERNNSLTAYIDSSYVWQGVTLAGLAGTATALAADPDDCSANQFANAIAASGNLSCAALADGDIPDTITIDLAAAATALAANGANCSAGQAPLGVDASGAAESCFDVATQSELDTHAGLASVHHAATVNTDAESKCNATEYLQGDGSCDVLPLGSHTVIDATPVNGELAEGISSDWAFDHNALATAHHTATVSGDITHDSTSGGTTDDAHFDHADDLAELNAQIGSGLVTGAHTVDTSASVDCSGSTTYLDGEGNCDDISSVYQAADSALTALASAFWGRDTTANICDGTPAAAGDFAISSDEFDMFNSTGTGVGDWRNGRTGAGACQ